ncbi:MAG: hypothetical protein F4X40_05085 [Chloroflexi bacterium]|nr:hypothetical protein [Chloroflexota bacterium]
MRLLDAAFDVLRKAGEPLSPAEIVRQIKSARIQIDANEPLDDASVKVELEHLASDGTESSGIVQTPSGRFTLPSMLDKTIRTSTSIATTAASTINPISIASSIARANVGAMWTVQDAVKEVLRRAKRPLSIDEMTTVLEVAGVLRGKRSEDESKVRSQLIQDMLQHGRESTFVRVGNNTYALRYYSAESGSPDRVDREFEAVETSKNDLEAATVPEPEDADTLASTEAERPTEIAVSSRLARDVADTARLPVSEEDDHNVLRRVRTLTNQRFERFIVVFLASLGMTDIKVINRLRPGELDIHATMSVAEVMEVNFSIQALNWVRDVHGGDIQLLRGGMRIGDHGLIITTSEFQRSAIEEATRKDAIPIATINGAELVKIAKDRGAVRVLG